MSTEDRLSTRNLQKAREQSGGSLMRRVGRWFPIPNVIRKRRTIRRSVTQAGIDLGRTLNVGSQTTAWGTSSVNMDIVLYDGVAVVADAHALPFRAACFDSAVLAAVLQYCEAPHQVISEVARVLRPGGHIVIDTPFLQPYCQEQGAVDRWRFSADALSALWRPYGDVLSVEASIGSGSALAHAIQHMPAAIPNRVISYAARWTVSWLVRPLGWWPFDAPGVVGAYLLIGRRRPTEA